MIYVFNFTPGINARLFCEWFLKHKATFHHDGYELKFDETGFNFQAFKNGEDLTHVYSKTHFMSFKNGLPEKLYNELKSIPTRVVDLTDTDLHFVYDGDVDKRKKLKAINNLCEKIDQLKGDVIIYGLFNRDVCAMLQSRFQRCEFRNIVIDYKTSYEFFNTGILLNELYDGDERLRMLFDKAWDIISTNSYDTIYLKNAMYIKPFRDFYDDENKDRILTKKSQTFKFNIKTVI